MRCLHITLLLILCALCFTGLGCNLVSLHRTDTAALRGPYRMEVYEGGKLNVEFEIEQGSVQEQAIQTWFNKHQSGWSASLITFAPHYLIRGEGFNLSVHSDGFCILNYRIDGNWVQVTKHFQPDEIAAILALHQAK